MAEDDAIELDGCPVIEVVFLVDTSESTDTNVPFICTSIQDSLDIVRQSGLTVNSEILEIASGVTDCFITTPGDCCSDVVSAPYTSSTPGLPEQLGTCGGCDAGDCEDWGPATAIVAGNKDWANDTIRIVIPISDEGPRCGNPIFDPGTDRDAIDNAIPIVSANRVIVVPIVDSASVALAQGLADAGPIPGGTVLSITGAALAEELADFIRSTCPKDCNYNGIIDFCEIDDGTSPDCFSHETDCCLDRCEPGCDNPDDIPGETTTAECVCNEDPIPGFLEDPSSCCDSGGAWTRECGVVA